MRPITEIQLGRGYVAIVYSDTYERLKLGRWPWRAQVHPRGYVYAACSRGGMVYLHRVIMGDPRGLMVDHRDRDTLNCRDDNLRIATTGQNRANAGRVRRNSSGLKGVTWHKSSGKWLSTITKDGIRYYLGLYQHKKRAAVAHDRAALALHGQFAGLNYPERGTKPRTPMRGYVLGSRK